MIAHGADTFVAGFPQTAGNGLLPAQDFDPETEHLSTILADTGNIVENFSYT